MRSSGRSSGSCAHSGGTRGCRSDFPARFAPDGFFPPPISGTTRTGLYLDGRLAPHLELAHHPFRKGETYDEQLGNAARKRVGDRKWNKRVRKAIDTVRALTNFDRLYIGGGNAKRLDFTPAPDITLVANRAGIEGGAALWSTKGLSKGDPRWTASDSGSIRT